MKITVKLFCIAVLSGLLFSCSEAKKETKKFIRPVKYQKVGYLGGEKLRTFSGTAQIDKIIGLSFRSSGIITTFNIKLGQKVKKDQLISTLDNVQARLNYESAISTKNSAESQMNTAKLNLNRVRSLFEKGSASLSDFEAAKNSYKTAQESFESSKRSVDIQQEKTDSQEGKTDIQEGTTDIQEEQTDIQEGKTDVQEGQIDIQEGTTPVSVAF